MSENEEIKELRKRIEELEDTVKTLSHIEESQISEIAVNMIKWLGKNEHILDDIKNDILDEANPREVAEAITKGEIPLTHIGDPTVKILEQELFSLLNQKKMFRKDSWENRFFTRLILLKEKLEDKNFAEILQKIKPKFHDIDSHFLKFQNQNKDTSKADFGVEHHDRQIEAKPNGEL